MNTINDSDFIRYQRQICLPEFGESGQLKLEKSRVLMIGCGGLGSLVAPYLAGAGVGSIVIIDDDNIDISNLHRQFIYRESEIGQNKAARLKSNLNQLNSKVQVRAIKYRLTEQQLDLEVMMCDVVIDCTDNFTTRHQINRVCFKHKTTLISAAVIGWQGQLAVYHYQADEACYRCIYPEDMSEPRSCSTSGVIGPVVGVMASMQALACIKNLISTPNHSPQSLVLFNGLNNTFQTLNIIRDPECPVCATKEVTV